MIVRKTQGPLLLLNAAIAFFFAFFTIYSLQITFLPVPTATIVAFMSVALLFAVYAFNGIKLPADYGAALSLSLFAAYLAYVSLANMISPVDTVFVRTAILFFVIAPTAVYIAYMFSRFHDPFRVVALLILLCICVQAMFIIIDFLFHGFREFTGRFIPYTGNIEPGTVAALVRARGLTNSSGAALASMQAIGLFLVLYLYRERVLGNMMVGLMVTLILVSIGLTGRTGLLAIPLVFITAGWFLVNRLRLHRRTLALLAAVPIAASALIAVFYYSYTALGGWTTSSGEDGIRRTIRWITDEFGGDYVLGSRTFTKLIEHWFFPDTWRIWLLGDTATASVARVPSDVGVVRRIWGTGAIGMTLLYLSHVVMGAYCYMKARGGSEKALILLVFFWILFLELKEPFVLHVRFAFICLLLFACLYFRGEPRARPE